MKHSEIIGELMKGHTQLEISKKLGLTSCQMISNIYRGLCLIPPEAAAVLSVTYDIPHTHFLDGFLEAKREDWIKRYQSVAAKARSQSLKKRKK